MYTNVSEIVYDWPKIGLRIYSTINFKQPEQATYFWPVVRDFGLLFIEGIRFVTYGAFAARNLVTERDFHVFKYNARLFLYNFHLHLSEPGCRIIAATALAMIYHGGHVRISSNLIRLPTWFRLRNSMLSIGCQKQQPC